MKIIFTSFLFMFLSVLSSMGQDKLNIAVLELDGNGVSETDLGELSNRIRTELFNTGRFNVIERSRMDEILREQGGSTDGLQ